MGVAGDNFFCKYISMGNMAGCSKEKVTHHGRVTIYGAPPSAANNWELGGGARKRRGGRTKKRRRGGRVKRRRSRGGKKKTRRSGGRRR